MDKTDFGSRKRRRNGSSFAKDPAVAKAARTHGIAYKHGLDMARRVWASINTGSRVEQNAPAPGARKRGSGRKTVLDPWVLELAKAQAKIWRGYFSVDDMWEFLQHKCEEERCVMDFSRSAVYKARERWLGAR